MTMSIEGKKVYTDEELCKLIKAGDKSKSIDLIDNCRAFVFDIIGEIDKYNHTSYSDRKPNNIIYSEVRHQYSNYYPLHLDEDLVSVGFMALLEAAEKYDEKKGAKFKTFAYRIVAGMVRKEQFRKRMMLHIPKDYKEKLSKYVNLYNHLDDGVVSEKEIIVRIANEFKTSIDEVEKVLGIQNLIVSLDQTIKSDKESDKEIGRLSDLLRDESVGIEEDYCEREMERILYEFIDALNPQERQVINSYYGFNGFKKSTIEEIAKENERSEKTISKILKQATESLRGMYNKVL